MEKKALKKYFTSGSFKLFIVGIVISVASVLWFIIRFTNAGRYVRIHFVEILFLLIGPIFIFSAIKSSTKTRTLLSMLKRTNNINDVYLSFSNTAANISFKDNEIIISDKYLFLKDEVAVIPYQQITQMYTTYTRNSENEITGISLFCDSTQKTKILIFANEKDTSVILQFAEIIRQKSPNIHFNLFS